jgi:hypothetical protein
MRPDPVMRRFPMAQGHSNRLLLRCPANYNTFRKEHANLFDVYLGTVTQWSAVKELETGASRRITLEQNYPNPFNVALAFASLSQLMAT